MDIIGVAGGWAAAAADAAARACWPRGSMRPCLGGGGRVLCHAVLKWLARLVLV